ncbi:hypothetical protein [Pseudalkalibacillus salsuginis]|uniref:hypothetical protein n=1 Tax=Pseudalkalibacillus salsuginis TaxID=2910972 RepID=UPI001F47CB33|nr:hypothetical protein [Pseudalkalibacillus salsuginis]MCF6411399.1 hypothetical protein [Pseudalkalibacillus salsuginis]
MDQDQFLLYDHQKPIRLRAERVAVYLQGEIIESYSEDNAVYYLFFYKYQFLTAVKATRLRRRSFIEKAFKRGMVFNAPHPFIKELLSSNHPCQILSFNPLLDKLEKHYTPQEKAFILTFFESFIPKKQLFNEIKAVFYHYNRKGQTFLGYKIIRILMDFAPNHSLVEYFANDIKVQKYADLYNKNAEKILAEDFIFAEKALYYRKKKDSCFQQLTERLEKESRWIDLIALFSCKLTSSPSTDYYYPLIKLLEAHFDEYETMSFLEALSSKLPEFRPLQQNLFQHYIKHHKIEAVSHMMKNHDFELNSNQVEIFGDLLEQVDPEEDLIEPEMLHTVLGPVMNMYPEKADNLLTKYVISLLKTEELSSIQEWLRPFNENYKNLQIIRKIDTMQELSNDPDQMQTLGELYYEFRQLNQAVECFSWQTELNPTDPKPLRWLAKVYGEMGKTQESEAYRQQCINLQKLA